MRYLFIPSCEVAPQDSLRGTTTEYRLQRGLELWRTGTFDRIVVMGGVYLPSWRQTRPSAELMYEWLVEHGVHSMYIIVEARSRDTYENISLALELLPLHDPHLEITVVSHWQHTLRIAVTFWRAHRLKVRIIPLWYWVSFKTFCVEWVGLFVHLFDKTGTSWFSRYNKRSRTFPE